MRSLKIIFSVTVVALILLVVAFTETDIITGKQATVFIPPIRLDNRNFTITTISPARKTDYEPRDFELDKETFNLDDHPKWLRGLPVKPKQYDTMYKNP